MGKSVVITFARIKTISISCLSVFPGSTQYTFLIKSKVCFVKKKKKQKISRMGKKDEIKWSLRSTLIALIT